MTQAHEGNAELPEGTTLLERYTIIDRIADGGMATIYRATDERLDRVVCVKLLRLEVEGSGSTGHGAVYHATYSHFLKEALALSKLQHPNTLRIYDFGYLDEFGRSTPTSTDSGPGSAPGRPFQISEFLDGGNLEQLVRARGPLGADETLAVVERVAGAVAEAHQHKIIHRDIKPSNILFSRVGAVLMPKLADFGIARCDLRKRAPAGTPEETLETVSTIPLFSPRWAAPEQLAEAEEGPATDVYALGLVTAFMLAGRALFDVDDVRSTFTERVRGDSYVRSRLAQLPVSAAAQSVLLDALRADPHARVRTAQIFAEELARAFGSGVRGAFPPAVAARPTFQSITLEAIPVGEKSTQAFRAPERHVEVAGRRVRIVDVHEKLDLTIPTAAGGMVRFRVTLIPARPGYRMNLKGLNCFVARPGGRASPALVADHDGAAELVSMAGEKLDRIAWAFGALGPSARTFLVGSAELPIPLPEGREALALELGPGRELVVICRRP